ncbi:NAD(+)/NADH kinase [Amycolatopsis rhabdoformis]|uniref:NAD kinase n=1 Tax=Amycolatopsis rhabdoformis TaxID=1448059 RepID=A0ABZ1IL78_9PSEU|nr:NAD(+)/NADH kinase [Amycolatopsis rhabdoformis]WSE34508.1 NAD(+)/NADH kinase [Amycolatopsis rhabdoformis]
MGASEVVRVGVVAHPRKAVGASVDELVSWAARRGVELVARRGDAAQVGAEVPVVSDADFAAGVDAIVSLGGDGTMLGAMRLAVQRPVPVLGVNYGNVGFLVEIMPSELAGALERLHSGDFEIEPHSCVALEEDGATVVAFNDVVVGGAEPGATVEVDLFVDSVRFGYYRCDALILSTPTGSTAYNYAAGGPVISPAAEVLAVTPVASMSGVSRAIVLPARDVVTLRSAARSAPPVLRVDGNAWRPLDPATPLTATLRPDAAQVVRLDPERHAQRSRVKLSLLDLPLRPEQMAELLPTEMREDLERLRERRHLPER